MFNTSFSLFKSKENKKSKTSTKVTVLEPSLIPLSLQSKYIRQYNPLCDTIFTWSECGLFQTESSLGRSIQLNTLPVSPQYIGYIYYKQNDTNLLSCRVVTVGLHKKTNTTILQVWKNSVTRWNCVDITKIQPSFPLLTHHLDYHVSCLSNSYRGLYEVLFNYCSHSYLFLGTRTGDVHFFNGESFLPFYVHFSMVRANVRNSFFPEFIVENTNKRNVVAIEDFSHISPSTISITYAHGFAVIWNWIKCECVHVYRGRSPDKNVQFPYTFLSSSWSNNGEQLAVLAQSNDCPFLPHGSLLLLFNKCDSQFERRRVWITTLDSSISGSTILSNGIRPYEARFSDDVEGHQEQQYHKNLLLESKKMLETLQNDSDKNKGKSSARSTRSQRYSSKTIENIGENLDLLSVTRGEESPSFREVNNGSKKRSKSIHLQSNEEDSNWETYHLEWVDDSSFLEKQESAPNSSVYKVIEVPDAHKRKRLSSVALNNSLSTDCFALFQRKTKGDGFIVDRVVIIMGGNFENKIILFGNGGTLQCHNLTKLFSCTNPYYNKQNENKRINLNEREDYDIFCMEFERFFCSYPSYSNDYVDIAVTYDEEKKRNKNKHLQSVEEFECPLLCLDNINKQLLQGLILLQDTNAYHSSLVICHISSIRKNDATINETNELTQLYPDNILPSSMIVGYAASVFAIQMSSNSTLMILRKRVSWVTTMSHWDKIISNNTLHLGSNKSVIVENLDFTIHHSNILHETTCELPNNKYIKALLGLTFSLDQQQKLTKVLNTIIELDAERETTSNALRQKIFPHVYLTTDGRYVYLYLRLISSIYFLNTIDLWHCIKNSNDIKSYNIENLNIRSIKFQMYDSGRYFLYVCACVLSNGACITLTKFYDHTMYDIITSSLLPKKIKSPYLSPTLSSPASRYHEKNILEKNGISPWIISFIDIETGGVKMNVEKEEKGEKGKKNGRTIRGVGELIGDKINGVTEQRHPIEKDYKNKYGTLQERMNADEKIQDGTHSTLREATGSAELFSDPKEKVNGQPIMETDFTVTLNTTVPALDNRYIMIEFFSSTDWEQPFKLDETEINSSDEQAQSLQHSTYDRLIIGCIRSATSEWVFVEYRLPLYPFLDMDNFLIVQHGDHNCNINTVLNTNSSITANKTHEIEANIEGDNSNNNMTFNGYYYSSTNIDNSNCKTTLDNLFSSRRLIHSPPLVNTKKKKWSETHERLYKEIAWLYLWENQLQSSLNGLNNETIDKLLEIPWINESRLAAATRIGDELYCLIAASDCFCSLSIPCSNRKGELPVEKTGHLTFYIDFLSTIPQQLSTEINVTLPMGTVTSIIENTYHKKISSKIFLADTHYFTVVLRSKVKNLMRLVCEAKEDNLTFLLAVDCNNMSILKLSVLVSSASSFSSIYSLSAFPSPVNSPCRSKEENFSECQLERRETELHVHSIITFSSNNEILQVLTNGMCSLSSIAQYSSIKFTDDEITNYFDSNSFSLSTFLTRNSIFNVFESKQKLDTIISRLVTKSSDYIINSSCARCGNTLLSGPSEEESVVSWIAHHIRNLFQGSATSLKMSRSLYHTLSINSKELVQLYNNNGCPIEKDEHYYTQIGTGKDKNHPLTEGNNKPLHDKEATEEVLELSRKRSEIDSLIATTRREMGLSENIRVKDNRDRKYDTEKMSSMKGDAGTIGGLKLKMQENINMLTQNLENLQNVATKSEGLKHNAEQFLKMAKKLNG